MVILLVALSLSMDAFSLAIIYGMFNFSKKDEITLSIIVGLYHFFMPLLGNYLGNIIFDIINIKMNIVVGIIFILIGIEMIIDTLKKEEHHSINNIIQMLIFGLAVSIDSFSVGLGFNYLTHKYILSSLIFSLFSFSLTYIGLNFGKRIGTKIGSLSTIIGSIILIILGLIYLFK